MYGVLFGCFLQSTLPAKSVSNQYPKTAVSLVLAPLQQGSCRITHHRLTSAGRTCGSHPVAPKRSRGLKLCDRVSLCETSYDAQKAFDR